jgi:hypothetical protein
MIRILYYVTGFNITSDLCIIRMHTAAQVQQNENKKCAKQVILKNYMRVYERRRSDLKITQPSILGKDISLAVSFNCVDTFINRL